MLNLHELTVIVLDISSHSKGMLNEQLSMLGFITLRRIKGHFRATFPDS